MNIRRHIYTLLCGVLCMVSCQTELKEENLFEEEIANIRSQFAPDKRVALFEVEAIRNNDSYILRGESDMQDAIEALKKQLYAKNVAFVDSIQLLPSHDLGENIKAIVNISVANLRSNPKHSAELATQATLGTPLKVLKKEGGWYYIQTPDKYLSWVDDGGITLMDKSHFERWQATDKIIYTKTYGHSYAEKDNKQVVSDLVAGAILETTGISDNYFQVKYPDGRTAFVMKDEAENYDHWLEGLAPTVDDLVATSETLMGVPYLWGGTSTKGMDCSGFTKTIYFLNGMVIPRDASQQVHAGQSVDSIMDFENLKKGDLLFFGTKATDSTNEKVVHVGMWIGNNEFIHASNMVRISSMDPKAENFDEWNRNRYLRTKRILREEDEALINLTRTPLFKD
ncbi:NlpC/P60 family protein [Maribacter algicola]|uniref:NlpC/P60 family protein n=1 Tax=Meishania litoralis TaxID=3434685 RepID=A0ACC7LI24_9FLAO